MEQEPFDFSRLELDIQAEHANAYREELLRVYKKYMKEIGPSAADAKTDAVMEAHPDAEPLWVAMTVHSNVSAEAALTAVALLLAQHSH